MNNVLIEGSSKIFCPTDDHQVMMIFKDAIHGANREDEIYGTGELRKIFTYYFYRFLESKGVVTHLTEAPLHEKGIFVKQCQPIKLEIIVRNVARGHWVDAHKVPLFEGGTVFDSPIVEFCLKLKTQLEDGRILDDPRITTPIAIALHHHAKDPNIKGRLILTEEEAKQLEKMALLINRWYSFLMKKQRWIVEDFKFEVGIPLTGERQFILIDEISPDSSRIRDKKGNSLTKDLFRQKRHPKEIYEGYKQLADAVKMIYEKESCYAD